ncbi:Uncharacterised protein [Escherichia coli]|uniref:Uncharacterized protein n=1 Tax=Escherichia coli TaxID=562 RepID=A0A2X1LVK1_ECOLX|nr:Uncharacterised protein [Escherichia coli]
MKYIVQTLQPTGRMAMQICAGYSGCWWGHESEMEEMPAGTTLTLPDVAWLRNKIRDYASAEPEIENA